MCARPVRASSGPSTSTEARIKLVAQHATGFIYLVSVTGITGARAELPPDLKAFVQRVRKHTNLPLAIGFGIGTGGNAADTNQHDRNFGDGKKEQKKEDAPDIK